jgi:NifB/MoaA-like Fe-S oxidoreductase
VIQRKFRKKFGTTFAFLGDEIYLRAGGSVPSRAHYGSYPQIEDGIGMVRSFQNEFSRVLKRVERLYPHSARPIRGSVLTGTLFAPVLESMIQQLNERFGMQLHVVAVENNYFGGDVSVAGLLTGSDLLAARDRVKGDFVIIPKSTLKSDEAIMLDGMKLDELTSKLGVPVYPFDLKSFERFLYQSN